MLIQRLIITFSLIAIPLSLFAQPWTPVAIWERQGLVDSAGYGTGIYTLGDQNDDHYADWAVVAYGSWRPGFGAVSYVEFFHGGNPASTTPYLTFDRDSTMWDLISDGVGDINGDGYNDWYVSRRYRSATFVDVVSFYYGGTAADTIPDAVLHLRVGHQSIWGMGDFNGDGFDDIYRYNDDLGEGLVYFGSAAFDTNWDWRITGASYYTLPAGFGDINGDSFADILSVNDAPGMQIFRGGFAPDTTPIIVHSVSSLTKSVVHDLTGDGRDEILHLNPMTVSVYLGSDSVHSVADYNLNFGCDNEPDHAFSAGDLNSDGYDDVIIYSRYCITADWGLLYVYLGHPWLNAVPALIIWGRGGPLNLPAIWTARGLGDINGDGVDDFAIGAVGDDVDSERGKVVIVSGDSSIHAAVDEEYIPLPVTFSMSVSPNPFNSSSQISFTLPVTARVSLRLYDVLGREVKILMDEVQTAGEHRVSFDGGDLSSGLYLCRMQAGEFEQTRKVVLIR